MVDVTFTRMVQVEFAGMVAVFNVTDDPPALAAKEAELPQFDNEGETGSASRRLAGSSSVNDVRVSATSGSLFLIRIAS